MGPRVTCYGGVGEIGGNKFLLEDRGTKVILDFGKGFAEDSRYYDSRIEPRAVNGAGDLFEFGLLPELPGLYSEEALQNTGLRHSTPEVDAVVLSHFHSDHTDRVQYVDPEVPVYCGGAAALMHESSSETGFSPLKGRKLRTFRTGRNFRVGPMEFDPIHVDHSIPGAYGFVVHTSEGALVYTGDFRFHGPAGHMTDDFADAASASKPSLLITEGTRVGHAAAKGTSTERDVEVEATRLVRESSKLVFSSFRGNDIDRVRTFCAAATASGRRLLVSMKVASILDRLKDDPRLRVPRVGKDLDVYVRRKKTGRLDDRDYYTWERRYLSAGVPAEEVRRRQTEVFLHLESWNFPELIDIAPERGGTYIHSATEAFNEEGEREEDLVRNWVDHFGFSYHQLHASGHAPAADVKRLVARVGAAKVVPVHTEHPEAFGELLKKERSRVELPTKGRPVAVALA